MRGFWCAEGLNISGGTEVLVDCLRGAGLLLLGSWFVAVPEEREEAVALGGFIAVFALFGS